jgi:hypothetical protein
MTALKDIMFMSGKKSDFKFKLGDIVVPTFPNESARPVGPSKVTGLQLNGYVVIEPLGTPHRHLVEAKDYERFEGQVVEADDGNPSPPSGR